MNKEQNARFRPRDEWRRCDVCRVLRPREGASVVANPRDPTRGKYVCAVCKGRCSGAALSAGGKGR